MLFYKSHGYNIFDSSLLNSYKGFSFKNYKTLKIKTKSNYLLKSFKKKLLKTLFILKEGENYFAHIRIGTMICYRISSSKKLVSLEELNWIRF